MKIGRTLPPVASPVSLRALGRAARAAAFDTERAGREVVDAVAAELRVRDAFAFCSGKAALATVLSALHALSGRRKVVIPAYTCYSIPSAIVKAGLDVVPCDLAPRSFDYDYEQLSRLLGSDVLAVISVHLFGIPSDTDRVAALCRPAGIFTVEDAAQAMGIRTASGELGTRGDVGVFSLGRGKNLTTGSGGLAVTNTDEIARLLRRAMGAMPPHTVRDDFVTLAGLLIMSVFISPRLYWLPAGLPFLRLGETIFHDDFPISPLPRSGAALLRGWRDRLSALNDRRRTAARYYIEHIAGASDIAAVPYLRFPLLLENAAERARLLDDERASRLGITGMYPATVGAIPQLANRLTQHSFAEAERMAASLLTLPTHPLVSPEDLKEICAFVNGAMGQAAGPRRSPADALATIHDERVAVDA